MRPAAEPADHVDEVSRLFAGATPPLSMEGARALGAYLSLLFEWSRRINLTGFRTPRAAAEGLLYDAVELAPLIDEDAVVLDVGAGAGGSAVALATLRTDLSLRMVEPRTKRAVFLRTVVRELGLAPRLQVLQSRAEAVEQEVRDTVDVAYAKAVMPPEAWLELGPTLVRPGGTVLCLTSKPLDELGVELPRGLSKVSERAYALPLSGNARVVTAVKAPRSR